MRIKEAPVRLAGLVLCEAVTLFTLICMVKTGQYTRILTAAGTIFLVLLPELMQRWCGCRFSLPLYLFSIVYALGPMIGQCWNVYYTVTWWDKLLHACGGVMFAIAGVYLFQRLAPENRSPAVTALFGLLFSLAVAVLWEFAEFGMDTFLGMDMQNDTVVTGFCSYLLADTVGETTTIENITSVLVNGVPLPVDGYLDIGLIDTMVDMLVASAGALVTCLLLWLDGGKHPPIDTQSKEK